LPEPRPPLKNQSLAGSCNAGRPLSFCVTRQGNIVNLDETQRRKDETVEHVPGPGDDYFSVNFYIRYNGCGRADGCVNNILEHPCPELKERVGNLSAGFWPESGLFRQPGGRKNNPGGPRKPYPGTSPGKSSERCRSDPCSNRQGHGDFKGEKSGGGTT